MGARRPRVALGIEPLPPGYLQDRLCEATSCLIGLSKALRMGVRALHSLIVAHKLRERVDLDEAYAYAREVSTFGEENIAELAELLQHLEILADEHDCYEHAHPRRRPRKRPAPALPHRPPAPERRSRPQPPVDDRSSEAA